ncbi:hypothetical protein E4P24_02770 [Haloferax sp. AS1]|uniref:DUF6009 family protein n=1 Tax=Haloferax sp. AS1 TaxID=2562277 RepID=UPI00165F83EA|nr:DUF6009 family protein [Haloferax sp. AS1]MBC9985294.1 hypothetical protein [Haloferax sp. AS1]
MLEAETELVWVKDPEEVDYLREFKFHSRKAKGEPPKGSLRGDYILFGYTEVDKDDYDSKRNQRRRQYERRMFILKEADRGGPKWDGKAFSRYTPKEAVDPREIEVGIESEALTP